MNSNPAIADLIRGVQAADEHAIQSIWDRYFPQLVHLAGKRLNGQRRQVADEEDIAISVMESFFRAAKEGRFPDLQDEDGIWRILARMTRNKVIDLVRKNSVRPIVGESALGKANDAISPIAAQPGSDPTPDVLAAVADEIERLIAILPEKYYPIAMKKLECLTVAEIASQCGVHISTVERRLRIIRGLWAQELAPSTTSDND